MSIKRWQASADLDRWFNAHSEKEKAAFERKMGICWSQGTPEQKYGAVNAWLEITDREEDHAREDAREARQYEFMTRLEKARIEAFAQALQETSRIIREGHQEDTKRLEQVIARLIENQPPPYTGGGHVMNPFEGRYLPESVTYMDCWRKHAPDEHFPEGRPGPARIVHVIPREEGIHYRCMIAMGSQKPEGFARLGYQIFHEELLRQGDCPRPYSRSITRRIPLLSWLLVRPDVCPLADAGDYLLGKDGSFNRVSD